MTAERLRVVLDGRVIGDRFPGISRYVVCLAEALVRTGDVDVILLHRPSTAGAREVPAARGAVLHAVDLAPFSLGEQARLPALARRLSPDVWHAPYYVMPYRRLPCPTVVTLYDTAPLALPSLWPWHRRRAFTLLHRLALRSADRVIAVSAAARDDLVRHFAIAPERLTVTPLAAAPSFRPQPVEERVRVRRAYDLPPRFVLTVATDKPSKNLDRFVAAFAGLSAADPTLAYGCVIAGAHRRDARIPVRGTAAAVRWLGIVPEGDLPALYASADLFVSPSLHEGFGLPVIEAMACGTPVACSRVPSHPEVVGDAGVLFDPTDGAALAAVIRTLMDDPMRRAEIGRRGLARAALHDWDDVARRTLAVYRSARRP
jgi:alpha-1,3-rhamnosyl/mannosyltransferase